jgi:3-isopropylmalate dehydrogenase
MRRTNGAAVDTAGRGVEDLTARGVRMRELRIAVFPGDGIGREVMAPCLALLETVRSRAPGFRLQFESYEAGADLYRRTGVALPDEAIRAAESADAILLGAMGSPDVRYPDGTEVVPQLDLRERFQLYAGVRPIRVLPGSRTPLADPRVRQVDCVLVRESTEGLFAARTSSRRDGDDVVFDTMRVSRRSCERLFAFAFDLARRRRACGRPGRVTCVDKANVLPSMAFFREIFLESAARHPDIEAECLYVDAAGLRLVRSPWQYDVLVTENMFGDILSDVGAALMGGMGMAPSADIGDEHAVFQPCHGTAPDIAGRGLANPTAMFLSAAMMLDWLGQRHDLSACSRAAADLRLAVEAAFADGSLVPVENGGTAGTEEITARVRRGLEERLARGELPA